jgi:glutamate dehydrogenase/leucine dehydrogenase
MTLTLDAEFDHEKLLCIRDADTGLLAVIAFHSTRLGPAVGGMRYRQYGTLSEAIVDALRLSRAMTLKNAAAGLDWGGGKLCVVDDGDRAQRTDRLLRLADLLNELAGSYIVGKDVGATLADMDILASRSSWVVGIPEARGGLGDPSPATARTVIGAMDAAASVLWDADNLAGRSAAIIGAGGVGGSLADLLAERGVRLLLADVDAARVSAVADRLGGQVVSVREALTADIDFLAPCATGEMISAADVPALRCRVVAGGANNPLVDHSVARLLQARGILYVPDFLSNAGGVIQNAAEFHKLGWDALWPMIDAANDRTLSLLRRASTNGHSPLELALSETLASVASGIPAGSAHGHAEHPVGHRAGVASPGGPGNKMDQIIGNAPDGERSIHHD